MRGRLINPFDVVFARLDLAATAADPTPAGDSITSGFDPDFGEPIVLTTAQGEREPARKEKEPIRIACQIEVAEYEAMQAFNSGDSPNSRITLVFHFRDLEEAGLVDDDGQPLIRTRDRLVAIYERCSDVLVMNIRTPPGLFVTQVAPGSFGLGRKRNTLNVTLEDRELGAR